MAANYTLTKSTVIIRTADGASIPADPLNADYQAYQAWVANGGVPDPYVPPAPAIQPVSPRQARLALLGAGLLDKVQAAVNAAGGATLITWEYATQFNRNDPMIVQIGASLNLTSAQIDQLFVTAATL